MKENFLYYVTCLVFRHIFWLFGYWTIWIAHQLIWFNSKHWFNCQNLKSHNKKLLWLQKQTQVLSRFKTNYEIKRLCFKSNQTEIVPEIKWLYFRSNMTMYRGSARVLDTVINGTISYEPPIIRVEKVSFVIDKTKSVSV